MATTTEQDKGAGAATKGKVVRKPRFKRHLEEVDIVGPRGVPKILNDLSSVKFSADNKKNLRLLLSTYATWGRTIGPAFEFEEFVIKLEKFSGTRSVRNMVDTLRRGEEYIYTSTKPHPNPDTDSNTNTNTNTNDHGPNPDNADMDDNDYRNDNLDDIDLDEVMEFEKRNEAITPTNTKALTQEEMERMENNRLEALQRRQQRTSDGTTAPVATGGGGGSGSGGGFFSNKFAAAGVSRASGSDKPISDGVSDSNESEILVNNANNHSEPVESHTDPDNRTSTNESEILVDNDLSSSINHPSTSNKSYINNSNSNDCEPDSDNMPDR